MLNNAKEKKKDLKIIMFEFKVFKTFLGGAGAGTAFKFRIRLHSNKGRFLAVPAPQHCHKHTCSAQLFYPGSNKLNYRYSNIFCYVLHSTCINVYRIFSTS